jgi:hypothetical protein
MSNNGDLKSLGYIVSELRHKYTNYDRLATFYDCQSKYRRQLDGACNNFINGFFNEEQFNAEIARIEAEVDLTDKKNQKRYIKEKIDEITAGGDRNKKRVKFRAEEALLKALRFSAYINKKKNNGRAR